MFDSRMSDINLMIYTVLKSTYTKLEPNVSCKGQHKNFSKESFLKDLKLGLIITVFLTILIMSLKKKLHHHSATKWTKQAQKKI